MSEPLPRSEIELRLETRGLLDVKDWSIYDMAQISGRVPPGGQWFVFLQKNETGWLGLYPPGTNRPMAIGHEPPRIWSYECEVPNPATYDDSADEFAPVILRLLDLWRTGTPSNC